MDMRDHPFADTLKQMRKKPGGGFTSLTSMQKWEWHADVYAWNRVILQRNYSPCDPDSQWRDETRIEICARFYRTKIQNYARAARDQENQREGRDLINQWAQEKGYSDVDAYAAARNIHWSTAYREHIAEFTQNSTIVKSSALSPAAALGVTAREFKPSAEQLSRSRNQLGIPEPAREPDDQPFVTPEPAPQRKTAIYEP